MKKFTAILLSALMLCGAVSCGTDVEDKKPDTVEEQPDGNVTASGKTIVTVGMPGVNYLILPIITDFNNSQKEYELQIVDYSKKVEDDDINATKALRQLKLDIVSGQAPDIIAVNPSSMAEFVQKGMFADMYELMNEYGGVSKEDFLPNALKGFEVNGEIPAISANFRICTAAAKTKFVGDDAENWSLDELINTYISLHDEMKLLGTYSETASQQVYSYVSRKLAKECVDYTSYTCNFDSNPLFAQSLDFACRYAEENPYDYDSDDHIVMQSGYNSPAARDIALINAIDIRSFSQTTAYQIYTDFADEPITYVGYPSSDGNGAVTACDWLYGITDSCTDKEAAWQFILYMLTDNTYQHECNESNDGLPVIKSFLDEYFSNKDTEDYHSIYYFDDYRENVEKITPIPEETVKQLYDYILSVEFDPYFDYEVNNMIDEECAAVLAGEKSGEECAEILQSRVSIYLSEKK